MLRQIICLILAIPFAALGSSLILKAGIGVGAWDAPVSYTHLFYLISGANISLLLEMLFSEVSDGAQIEEIVNAAKDQMVYVNAMMGARSE